MKKPLPPHAKRLIAELQRRASNLTQLIKSIKTHYYQWPSDLSYPQAAALILGSAGPLPIRELASNIALLTRRPCNSRNLANSLSRHTHFFFTPTGWHCEKKSLTPAPRRN